MVGSGQGLTLLILAHPAPSTQLNFGNSKGLKAVEGMIGLWRAHDACGMNSQHLPKTRGGESHTGHCWQESRSALQREKDQLSSGLHVCTYKSQTESPGNLRTLHAPTASPPLSDLGPSGVILTLTPGHVGNSEIPRCPDSQRLIPIELTHSLL